MAKKKKNEEKFSNDDTGLVGSLLANAAEKLLNFDVSTSESEADTEQTSTVTAESEFLVEAEEKSPAKKTKSKKKTKKIEMEEAPVEVEMEASEAGDDAEMRAESEFFASESEESEASDEESASDSDELAEFGSTNIYTEEEPASFIPEANDSEVSEDGLPDVESVEGTELDSFEAADIEEVEFVEEERLDSILESILFASDRPVSLASLKLVFKGTNVKGDKIKRALERLAVELAGAKRGVTLEEVPGGYQLRTKSDNLQFLTRTLKARQFKLSGPALEVLAIVAYKQPTVKHEIDEIRGVESGHLLRALMEKGLVTFEGKSDLPGKPMLYATTKKFLEIFGLRNLKELPTLSQIDELLPEGMTEEEAKPTLSQVTESMSQAIGASYSEGEEELTKITDQLTAIDTSSEFFEQEKQRQKQKRDEERAQNIREALALGEEVPNRDRNWLIKYDEALAAGNMDQFSAQDQRETLAEEKSLEGQLDLEFSGEEAPGTVEPMETEVLSRDGSQPSEDEGPVLAVMDETAELEAALAASENNEPMDGDDEDRSGEANL